MRLRLFPWTPETIWSCFEEIHQYAAKSIPINSTFARNFTAGHANYLHLHGSWGQRFAAPTWTPRNRFFSGQNWGNRAAIMVWNMESQRQATIWKRHTILDSNPREFLHKFWWFCKHWEERPLYGLSFVPDADEPFTVNRQPMGCYCVGWRTNAHIFEKQKENCRKASARIGRRIAHETSSFFGERFGCQWFCMACPAKGVDPSSIISGNIIAPSNSDDRLFNRLPKDARLRWMEFITRSEGIMFGFSTTDPIIFVLRACPRATSRYSFCARKNKSWIRLKSPNRWKVLLGPFFPSMHSTSETCDASCSKRNATGKRHADPCGSLSICCYSTACSTMENLSKDSAAHYSSNTWSHSGLDSSSSY